MAKKKNECIYERNNSYQVKIPYYDENGNRTYYSKTFPVKKYGTKAKALEMARKHRDEIRGKIANDIIIKPKHYTLDDVFNLSSSLHACKLGTKKKETGTYNKYIKSFIGGDRDFATIKYSDIQLSLNAMVSSARNDTIQRAMSIWRRLYKHAIASDIVMKDETYNVSMPRSELIEIKKPMECTLEDVVKVCEQIEIRHKSKREALLLQGILWVMWFTGMRPAEVCALDTDHVDLVNRWIYVRQSVGTSEKESGVIRQTKNDYSIRDLEIVDDYLLQVFYGLLPYAKNGYLFVRDNGKFIDGTYLSDMTRRYSNGTFRPYMIRHQFATDLSNSNVGWREIKDLMGHSSSKMTIEYARSNNESRRNALKNRSRDIKMIENVA